MRIIDRYLLRQFLHTFSICFLSLTGIFIVFDAFTNLEAFMHCAKGLQMLRLVKASKTMKMPVRLKKQMEKVWRNWRSR